MSKKSAITFYGIWPEMKEYVEKKMKKFSCEILSEKLLPENVQPDTEILASFVESPINKAVLDKMINLKLIATLSTGYDHIDLKECKKRGIIVENVPTYGENTVAEQSMALLLGLTRKLFRSVKRVKEGRYDFHGLRGVDLAGKTVGIIGTGHIGAHFIKMISGFDVKIIAYDKFKNKDLIKKYGIKYLPLNSLLKKSDIISLHTPLLPSTFHLINKTNIKLTKPGAFLINTARGALIETEAIVWALQNEHLAGVGLDVLEDENLIQNFERVIGNDQKQIKTTLLNEMIINHPNAIVTPHNAFNSTEALQRIIDVTIDNIQKFGAGKIQNEVKILK
ncbi:MAG: NAD(P)-dependent oxidoreductase [Patescibacteria group bacterium]|jgi:D-lactate dehydrogenase